MNFETADTALGKFPDPRWSAETLPSSEKAEGAPPGGDSGAPFMGFRGDRGAMCDVLERFSSHSRGCSFCPPFDERGLGKIFPLYLTNSDMDSAKWLNPLWN